MIPAKLVMAKKLLISINGIFSFMILSSFPINDALIMIEFSYLFLIPLIPSCLLCFNLSWFYISVNHFPIENTAMFC
jgi:hypothetical protein